METATEIVNEEIEIPCYLCGKGKIKIGRGDISLKIPSPVDAKIKFELKQHLQKQIIVFYNKLNRKEKNEYRFNQRRNK